jgi:HK97 gp10 family phage protein
LAVYQNVILSGTGDIRRYNGAAVQYISRADEIRFTMAELERAALKEVAKFLRKEIKARVPVDEGTLKKNVGTWVKLLGKGRAGEKKGAPILQVGVYSRERAQRKRYYYAYHAHLIEFGTKKMTARPFLRPAVMDNIDQIRIIQGKYLKAIENENLARGLIEEVEEIADD